jgi:hypothetical protein
VRLPTIDSPMLLEDDLVIVASGGPISLVEVIEFAGCQSAACAPPPYGSGGSRPGHVGTVLPTSKSKTVPNRHDRTRPMGRKSTSDKFWDGTMVESANRSGLTSGAKTGDEVQAQFAGNIRDLYDKMDKHGNDTTREIITNSEHWYPAAGKLSEQRANEIGMRRETSVAIMAALSPGHDWDSNISEHQILMSVVSKNAPVNGPATKAILKSILENQGATAVSDKQKSNNKAKLDDLDDLIARVDGKPFMTLSINDRARLMKAHAIAQGEDFGMHKWTLDKDGNAFKDGRRYTLGGEIKQINFQSEKTWQKIHAMVDLDKAGGAPLDNAISEALGAGAKVRSFNNNIGYPDSSARDVTIDTHATSVVVGRRVAQTSAEYTEMAGGMSTGGDGLKGPYVAATEAYRTVADERGIAPRAAQSQTWVAQKGINDALGGNPTTESLRSTLADPKKSGTLSPEARSYLEGELAIREAWLDLATKAGIGGAE